MNECICNSCKNLKSFIDEESDTEDYRCEFGFPSEECSECEDGVCELECVHYQPDDDGETLQIVKCSCCGKELTKAFDGEDEGEVFCVDCYLKRQCQS